MEGLKKWLLTIYMILALQIFGRKIFIYIFINIHNNVLIVKTTGMFKSIVFSQISDYKKTQLLGKIYYFFVSY